MCSIVQIDMLSNGTMGSKLVTSLSARLIRMDPPYFGPERTGNTASDAMITETPAARNQRSPFPAPHMDLPPQTAAQGLRWRPPAMLTPS